jgi:hypothetical protein
VSSASRGRPPGRRALRRPPSPVPMPLRELRAISGRSRPAP